jgi:predicted nucleic acid-binding protein
VLVDTSVLVRTLQPHHSLYPLADGAISKLRMEQRRLHLVPQNFVELWVVATRPTSQNGLGMPVSEVVTELARLKSFFTVLPENDEIYPAWEHLVVEYQVAGKPAHDARLVAAMLVHGIADILTFDKTGFTRYTAINAVHPVDVATRT